MQFIRDYLLLAAVGTVFVTLVAIRVGGLSLPTKPDTEDSDI